jgi:hypothetical protein
LSFCSALPILCKGSNVLLPRTEKTQKIHAHIFAGLTDAEQHEVFLNCVWSKAPSDYIPQLREPLDFSSALEPPYLGYKRLRTAILVAAQGRPQRASTWVPSSCEYQGQQYIHLGVLLRATGSSHQLGKTYFEFRPTPHKRFLSDSH